jgi:hypothetical protein
METAATPPYEPGQLVVYKSGGAKMTVVRCVLAAQVPVAANEQWEAEWGVKVSWVQGDGVPHDRFIDPRLIELYVPTAYERALKRFAQEGSGSLFTAPADSV